MANYPYCAVHLYLLGSGTRIQTYFFYVGHKSKTCEGEFHDLIIKHLASLSASLVLTLCCRSDKTGTELPLIFQIGVAMMIMISFNAVLCSSLNG